MTTAKLGKRYIKKTTVTEVEYDLDQVVRDIGDIINDGIDEGWLELDSSVAVDVQLTAKSK